MQQRLQIYLFLFFAFIAFYHVKADSIQYLKVRNITITGNKKTKRYVILREMTANENDSFAANQMDAILLQNRINIFNLKLFKEVTINIKNWEEDSLDLAIDVKERWAILPLPIIAFADRNVAEWWRQYRHDFKRLQYGVQVNWNNLTGRNDLLVAAFSLGFAQKLELGYKIPHFNRKKENVGLSLFLSMLRSKRVAFNTTNDVLNFLEIGKPLQLQKIEFEPIITYRRKYNNTHFFSAGYGYTVISDVVKNANPAYLLDGNKKQHYFKIGYQYEADFRNLRAYPTEGWYFKFNFTNYGLGFLKTKMTTTGFQFSKYNTWQKHKKFSVGAMIRWQSSWPIKQPYNLQPIKSFGYGENSIRGYEINVLDGQHFLLFKNEYRVRILSFKFKNFKKIKQKNQIILNSTLTFLPFNIYLTTYFDAGYVWDRYFEQNNKLKNKWQYGYGVALNLLTFNDRLLRLEYSANRYLEHGFYIHFELPF
jgi:outer membrane protein assembly factor BamA